MQITRCPECSFNPLSATDYLCRFCRSGEQSDNQEKFASFQEAHPEIAEFMLRAFFGEIRANEFLKSLAGQAVSRGHLSEKQLAAARKSMAFQERADEEAATLTPIPEEGRMEITGEVLSAKLKYTDFGDTLKLLIKDDRGFKVYGSCPKNIRYRMVDDRYVEIEKGQRVTLTGTVQISRDDTTFGFYSRPAKAKVL
jgi:hypothetical protein